MKLKLTPVKQNRFSFVRPFQELIPNPSIHLLKQYSVAQAEMDDTPLELRDLRDRDLEERRARREREEDDVRAALGKLDRTLAHCAPTNQVCMRNAP